MIGTTLTPAMPTHGNERLTPAIGMPTHLANETPATGNTPVNVLLLLSPLRAQDQLA